ncbi:hypothetical protein T03_10477 [Trichinella britovi]|uniref:Uncharacterized protein n=2 Tax=Trichinella TaxID=6333 RepID=A0A0V1CNU4_TRIBR|nr:hypothetical protein T05_11024 [Trichinella murrelli]KRY50818.1 hypothetical protein T03_10477 [Trichinella britovi]
MTDLAIKIVNVTIGCKSVFYELGVVDCAGGLLGISAIRTLDLYNKWPSRRRFWKKTVLEELATVYKSGWIITVNDEGQWQLNFRGQLCSGNRAKYLNKRLLTSIT